MSQSLAQIKRSAVPNDVTTDSAACLEHVIDEHLKKQTLLGVGALHRLETQGPQSGPPTLARYPIACCGATLPTLKASTRHAALLYRACRWCNAVTAQEIQST